MKILVVGSGGREHAICAAFARSPHVSKIYCANGNAGIAQIAECVTIKPEEINSLADFALRNQIDLTFVGGETALALGIVDEFEKRGLKIVGASKKAAQLEASKSFAKDFMARHGIPTARYVTAHSPAFAILELESADFGDEYAPVVVKADGLAAGKGVVVAKDRTEAIAAINDLENIVGKNATEKIVLEECLFGREVSLLMFADGENFALMPPVRDHKRIGEGDIGPNTGGMGTITDDSLLSEAEVDLIVDKIIKPTLHGCVKEGFPFRGILFLGLMMSEPPASAGGFRSENPVATAPVSDKNVRASVINVLEYNVRFGDPETQAILVRLETDLVDICDAMLSQKGGSPRVNKGASFFEGKEDALTNVRASAPDLASLNIEWRAGSSACVVLASKGYPQKAQTGDVIHGLEKAAEREDVSVFHAGTAFSSPPYEGGVAEGRGGSLHMEYITAGGRVLGITATGENLDKALRRAYEAVEDISWDGMQYRRDIGKTARS